MTEDRSKAEDEYGKKSLILLVLAMVPALGVGMVVASYFTGLRGMGIFVLVAFSTWCLGVLLGSFSIRKP
jgi:hypothetical protein